jgi:hypothetical protein
MPMELLPSYSRTIILYVRRRTERAVCEGDNARYDKWRTECLYRIAQVMQGYAAWLHGSWKGPSYEHPVDK